MYRIALSYGRGEKDAKTCVSTTGGATTSGTTGGAFQIKTEPVGKIRGGYRNSRHRGRRSLRGRAYLRVGAFKRCYNCDQPNFTPEHLSSYPGKSATCKFYNCDQPNFTLEHLSRCLAKSAYRRPGTMKKPAGGSLLTEGDLQWD